MGKLAIVRPWPIVSAYGSFPGASRVATPDPKEAAITTGAGVVNFEVDLGVARSIDTLFIGYTGSFAFSVDYGLASGGESSIADGVKSEDIAPDLFDPIRHGFRILTTPITARYVRVSGNFPGSFPVGVFAVGLKLESFWGHEWGAGRPIEDTGTADRLLGGGFGINEGVRVGGYQWTFGDLTDAETQALYRLARDRGTTRSTLVVEDPDRTAGLHERIHWGLLDRLEPYERLQPGATRWNLKIRDWA